MFKRIFLFLAVNALVVITISALLSILGVQPYLTEKGLDLSALAIFCLVWGMGGAFISLGLSRIMAKFAMGVQIIDPETNDSRLQKLVQTVHRLAQDAGLQKMPQVGVYNSPDLNAFATGPTRNRSLVAVSSGLLERMDEKEIEGVLGHEIAHISNGDMVTMTLLQGVVNAFVMFLARVLAYVIANSLRGDRDRGGGISGMTYFAIQFALEIVFMILGSIVVAWFSRFREYRADAGGARLAGTPNMIRALEALKRNYQIEAPQAKPALQTLQISGRGNGLLRFFSSHPPLEDRIARLSQAGTY